MAEPGLLQRLEWKLRKASESPLSGDYRSAFRGRGRDFDQVVPYAWGDDVRDIDWNVTARLGSPYRKQFVEERELSVVWLLEDSLSLQFGSTERSKRETLIELASLLALLSAHNRDRVGCWHATPRLHRIRGPARGRARALGMATSVMRAPRPDLVRGGAVEIDWQRLLRVFPRHSILVWLGDFPPRPSPPGWASLRQRYEVVGVRVDDPWDHRLPPQGVMSVFDPEAGRVLPLDTAAAATRRKHAAWCEAREDAWRELFPTPVDRLVVSTNDDPMRALVRFLRLRSRARGR